MDYGRMVSSGPSAHVLVCGEPGRPVQGMTGTGGTGNPCEKGDYGEKGGQEREPRFQRPGDLREPHSGVKPG